jgi:hypothetical protein
MQHEMAPLIACHAECQCYDQCHVCSRGVAEYLAKAGCQAAFFDRFRSLPHFWRRTTSAIRAQPLEQGEA